MTPSACGMMPRCKRRVFSTLRPKVAQAYLSNSRAFLRIALVLLAIFIAQCSNSSYFNGGLVASPSSPEENYP